MPTQGTRARKYTFEEIVIAVGIATGAPKKEIASSLGGITDRAVYYKIKRMDALSDLADAIAPLLPERREVEPIDPKNIDRVFADMTGHALSAVKTQLADSKNPKDAATLGLSVIKQIKEQTSGDSAKDHPLRTLSAEVLDAFEADVLIDRDLVARARGLEGPGNVPN